MSAARLRETDRPSRGLQKSRTQEAGLLGIVAVVYELCGDECPQKHVREPSIAHNGVLLLLLLSHGSGIA
jgi:hypothetical protein